MASRRVQRATTEAWLKDSDLDMQEKGRELKAKSSKGWGLVMLAYSTLGIVYGDIGTSPLYVYASIFPNGAPEDENVILGTFSTIFWTLTSMVLVKYVVLMLRADDNGEGGIIALYSIIKRAAGIPTITNLASGDEDLNSSKLNQGNRIAVAIRRSLHNSRLQQLVLFVVALLGVNMIISDGILTPAISVVSAVQGIQSYNGPNGPPIITNGAVVGITCGILVVLFLLQSFGTQKVAFLFSPAIFLWFASNSAIGLYNISTYRPSVFKALSPSYMYYYWSGEASWAWTSLGAVMLSITGAEALYADLGHFSSNSIRLCFISFVYPSLTLTYLGQTAYILEYKEAAASAFWSSLPRPVYIPMLVVATAAAVIASQALITGAFSITSQAMSIKCFPRFTVRHTNVHAKGQIYIPEVNYALMVGAVVIVAAFQDATAIGNAYGLAIITVMLIDTSMLSVVMLLDWNWPFIGTGAFWLVYTFLAAIYLSSAAAKVPHGAWFTLAVAGIISIISFVYYWGQTKKATYLKNNAVLLSSLLEPDDEHNGGPRPRRPLQDIDGNAPTDYDEALHPMVKGLRLVGTKQRIAKLPGIGLYYNELVEGVPPVLVKFLSLSPAMHEVVIFVTVRTVPLPVVGPDERLLVRKLEVYGFYHVIARYGYTESIDHGQAFVKTVVEEILQYLEPETFARILEASDETLYQDPEAGAGATESRVQDDQETQEIVPTGEDSLNTITGQRILSHIRQSLHAAKEREEDGKKASHSQRLPGVVSPRHSAGPWVRQPSVLHRMHVGAFAGRGRRFESSITVPLPPPPPRPPIYRVSDLNLERRSWKAVSSSGFTPLEGSQLTTADAKGISPSATLDNQTAASLRKRFQEIREQMAMEKAKNEVADERILLRAAYEHGVVHLLARAELRAEIVPETNRICRTLKKFVVEGMYRTMVVNTRPAAAEYNLPLETLLELRTVYEV